jgi:hypothetical protein
MIRQNPFHFAPNPNVRDMPEIPSQQKLALFNCRSSNMYCIRPGLLADSAWND